MATTTNIGLTKPAGTDKALVSVINSNSDIIDSAAGGLMDAIAIVANGNTHAAISAGQYVYVHNHGTLAEGLYTANSAIAANATLSTSNLTADASGGLNALNSKITDITTMSTSAGTFSTLAGLATILNTAVSSMNTYEIKRIRVDCSATVYPFTNGYSYDVELYKFNGDTYIHANFYAGGRLPIYVGVKDGSGWSFDELAINSKIEGNSTTTLSVSGLACTYIKRGGYCYARISGTPTTTSNITFTVPKALIGAYVTCGQWASTSNQMQVYIDADAKTLTIRNHALVGVNVIIMYPYA